MADPIDYSMGQGDQDPPVLPSTTTVPGSAPLPTGLEPQGGDVGSKIMQFLSALKAGTPQAGAPGAPGKDPQTLGLSDLGSMLGAMSSGEKANRFLKGNFTQGYDRLSLDAQKDRNSNESDAMKKLAQTSYIMGGGSKFSQPATMSLGGRDSKIPNLGTGPTPITDAERQGASTLQSQLQARLAPGGSYMPQPLSSYADPGKLEQISSYGGAGLSGLSAIDNMLKGGQSSQNGILSAIANLMKGKGSPSQVSSNPFGKPGASGGDIGKLLSNIFGKGGIDGSGNTEDSRTEDLRGGDTSGRALDMFGNPLPAAPYYDDTTGQYVDPAQQGSGSFDYNDYGDF